MENSSDTSQR